MKSTRRRILLHALPTTAALLLTPAGAQASDDTNIPSWDRIPRPAVRQDGYRNRIATEISNFGWKTFLGDLHVHSRGHTFGLVQPNVNRSEVHDAGYLFGFDFLAITNHATSWSDADEDASIFQYSDQVDTFGQPQYMGLKGSEDYVGPDDVGHATSFNRPLKKNSSLNDWHIAILDKYSADPTASVHVQLNHPATPDPYFQLPSTNQPGQPTWVNWNATTIAKVRDAIALAEYTGLPSYFELLRRGFRVAPTSNSDLHAAFRQEVEFDHNPFNDIFLERANGQWVMPYFEEPGVPRELIWGHITAHNRTGVVMPFGTSWNYENFLTALRNRWVFRTAHPRSSGFFMSGGLPMGSEMTLQSTSPLSFTVWGTTLNALAGDGTQWTKLEVWSPHSPDQPLHVEEFNDPSLLNLKRTFSLMPYESVYVIRLEQAMGSDVLMAPVWITNPLPKPTIDFNTSTTQVQRGAQIPIMSINGVSGSYIVQRANRAEGPQDWRTVKTTTQPVHFIDTTHLPKRSWWRVIDSAPPNAATNVVMLTVTDALDVTLPPPVDPPTEAGTVALHWNHTTPIRAAYYVSRDNGWNWTKVDEEVHSLNGRAWRFKSWQWGDDTVMIKVVDTANASLFGSTTPFPAKTRAPDWFPAHVASMAL
ncbi:hypothetical protein NVS55_28400 [Myxococcus stipitatus]|uniref:hypothetical protein n=1 Tax=Myxococcus stipitatus TaxID=83455 RepID=UPI003144EF77